MKSEFPLLQTERVILRCLSLKDAGDFHKILSFPELSALSNIPQSPTEKRSERFVSWMSKLFVRGTGCGWIITLKKTNSVIGAIRINEIHKKASYGEIGYELSPQYWGQGFMTEAVKAVTVSGHAYFKLNRMEAWVIPGNMASEAVLQKNYYQYEGTLRKRLNLRGQLCDLKMYSHFQESD